MVLELVVVVMVAQPPLLPLAPLLDERLELERLLLAGDLRDPLLLLQRLAQLGGRSLDPLRRLVHDRLPLRRLRCGMEVDDALRSGIPAGLICQASEAAL